MADGVARVGIIGAGRLGASLTGALLRAEYDVCALSRQDESDARATARRLGVPVGTTDPQVVADAADIVFLTAPDRDIERTAHGLTFRQGQTVVHCSGATDLSALEPAASQGAHTGSFHPLQSFPTADCSDRFEGITVGVASDHPPVLAWLAELAQTLGSRPLDLTGVDRGAYHGAAFMVAGLLATYLEGAVQLWTEAGLTRADALDGLRQLAHRALDDLDPEEAGRGLTGPISRGDGAVVRAHLAAIEKAGGDLLPVYSALAALQRDGGDDEDR